MTKIRTRALGAALAAGALVALPAAASAHPGHASAPADVVAKVTAHTERADAALDRAVELFADGRERPAAGAVHRSQAALRHAVKTTARIVRKADTDEERGVAATAVITVATEMDEEIPTLVGLLDTAQSPRADLRLAQAALADARGREKAIEILNDLVKAGLPAESQTAVTAAITALSTDRSAEIAKATAALEDPDTSDAAGKTIQLTINVTLTGQERAADILRQLIEQLPEEAQAGLKRALDAVCAEREDSAEDLDDASDRMPRDMRKFIDRLAHRHMTPPADDATAPEVETTEPATTPVGTEGVEAAGDDSDSGHWRPGGRD